MSCTVSKETLALHVEGDLSAQQAQATSQHLEQCRACRAFFDQLRARQSLLKTLRTDTVTAAECIGMRRNVMFTLERSNQVAGWLWIERTLMQVFARPSYALATFAVVVIVSASVLAQMRQQPAPAASYAAVFESRNTLMRPYDYRAWVQLDGFPADAPAVHGERTRSHRVYIDPEGYRSFVKTGAFAEHTMMIWERMSGEHAGDAQTHSDSSILLASVKDSARFEGGWGFFDFTGDGGGTKPSAPAESESSLCRTCHLEAETDSVFTGVDSALRVPRQHS